MATKERALLLKRISKSLWLLFFLVGTGIAQDIFIIGSTEAYFRWFIKDSLRGAYGIPQYEYLLNAGETWTDLNIMYGNWSGYVRFTGMYNSNLPDPADATTLFGINYWNVKYSLDYLSVEAGNVYKQFGLGTLFRTWEERALAIDNSLLGLGISAMPINGLDVYAAGGAYKSLRNIYKDFVKVLSISKNFSIKNAFVDIGVGALNRTLDRQTMDRIVQEINSYPVENRFIPTHNMYAAGGWMTLSVTPVTIYVEGAYKWKDIYREALNKPLISTNGYVVYGEVQFTSSKVWASAKFREIYRFALRINPYTTGYEGILNYLPAFSKMIGYQLAAYYMPVAQENGERAYQVDIGGALSTATGVEVSASWIDAIDNKPLFRMIYLEVFSQLKNKGKLTGAFQYVQYNIETYFNKPGQPMVHAYVPIIEYVHRFNKEASLKTQLQLMYTEQDHGSWVLPYLEFVPQHRFSLFVQDMWNFKPLYGKGLHYVSAGINWRTDQVLFSIQYRQTREGINCSGGICRYEPAFNGVLSSLLISF
ncbi:MAG: hypothetical protein GXO48_03870 [Chlorobi bacterium]|nr:hypothetical protein [Chlorobiota bacterium]